MPKIINYPHIASMVFNTPLYATHSLMQSVKSVLEPRMLGLSTDDVAAFVESVTRPHINEMSASSQSGSGSSSLYAVHGPIAVINVHGVLVPRRGVINNACSELVSYEYLREQIDHAVKNSAVHHIAIDFHTGGGAAMGCDEIASFIRASSKIKPITAIVNFCAYSAGFYLAAACTDIICSPTGGVGSIGVIMETYEISKYEKAVGITYNTFFRGDRKNDLSHHEEITDQARDAVNVRLDDAYKMFVDSVALHRGLSVEAVSSTQASLMSASEALELGFIDSVMPAQDAINAILARYSSAQKPAVRKIGAQASAMQAVVAL